MNSARKAQLKEEARSIVSRAKDGYGQTITLRPEMATVELLALIVEILADGKTPTEK